MLLHIHPYNSVPDSDTSTISITMQAARPVPLELVIRRMTTMKLSEIIGRDVFDPEDRHQYNLEDMNLGAKQYRVPDHQRFPGWRDEKPQYLVDTILKNFTFGAITMTTHVDLRNHTIYYNIQDGQTRLTTLQKFVLGKFGTPDGRLYDQLTEREREAFNAYQVHVEVISKPPHVTEEDYDKYCKENFIRVNCGTPLTSADKFWARKDEPMMKLLFELYRSAEFNRNIKKYCWATVGEKKTRSGLAQFAGIVLASAKMDTNCVTTSYERNGQILVGLAVDDEMKERVKSSLRWFFGIISCALPNVTKPKRFAGKLPSIIGIMLCDWINHSGVVSEPRNEMWVQFIRSQHAHSDFLDLLFARLTKAEVQNAETVAFNAKLGAIVSAYTPTRSFDHITAIPVQSAATTSIESSSSGSETDSDSD
jgi:hypothetical protein